MYAARIKPMPCQSHVEGSLAIQSKASVLVISISDFGSFFGSCSASCSLDISYPPLCIPVLAQITPDNRPKVGNSGQELAGVFELFPQVCFDHKFQAMLGKGLLLHTLTKL